MKKVIRILIVIGVLAGIGYGGYEQGQAYLAKRRKPTFRTATVEKGEIIAVRDTTGKVKPVKTYQVGSFVSGPITGLFVDFNSEVKEGQKLAQVDPRLFLLAVAREEAVLRTREAEVARAKAALILAKNDAERAKNDQQRARALQELDEDYISAAELDRIKYSLLAFQSQITLAESGVEQALAGVEQAKASLENANTNLGYTDITSPCDGMVLARKIEPGQTLAAQFQTPVLFEVVEDLKKEIHIIAEVDETDIGRISEAKKDGQPVKFRVSAYPEDLFEGVIWQIRKSTVPEAVVVTYPVVISAENPDMKLFPGMTAEVSFQLKVRPNVIKIPMAALGFYPEKKLVHPDDHKVLEGASRAEEEEENERSLSATEIAALNKKGKTRHVWIIDGEQLRAVEVVTGADGGGFYEMISGDLKPDQKLVTSVKYGAK